jgi:hypothetical protein
MEQGSAGAKGKSAVREHAFCTVLRDNGVVSSQRPTLGIYQKYRTDG